MRAMSEMDLCDEKTEDSDEESRRSMDTLKSSVLTHSEEDIRVICTQIRAAVERSQEEGLHITDFVVSYFEQQGDPSQLSFSEENQFAKQTLLDIIDIFASYLINNRQFLRRILMTVFPMSSCIDRRILLFEEAGSTPSNIDYQKIKNKFLYILQNVAGWQICTEDYPWNTAGVDSSSTCYLDLPMQRVEEEKGTSPILAEALYGIQHPEILLGVLRHTIKPNAFYLWPVILSADLKILQDFDLFTPEEAAAEETQIVKYFCRAHQGFQRIIVGSESSKSSGTSHCGMYSEKWLMMPESTAFMVPDDWSSNPCPLQHICRLAIREKLHEADNIPLGISDLPLPLALKKYVDLEF